MSPRSSYCLVLVDGAFVFVLEVAVSLCCRRRRGFHLFFFPPPSPYTKFSNAASFHQHTTVSSLHISSCTGMGGTLPCELWHVKSFCCPSGSLSRSMTPSYRFPSRSMSDGVHPYFDRKICV